MKTSNLLLVVLFGLGALSIIGDTMRSPATVALFIPITLIICFSPIGKAIANLISGKTSYSGDSYSEIQDLKNKYNQLESKLQSYEKEVETLRENVIFYESKKTIATKSGISLEKNF